MKGEDIDDPVPVQLKAGPAPRFSTGKVSGVLSVLNGSSGGSSGSWNTVVGWIGNGPWPTATPESGFSGRANGPSKFEGIAAEVRELGTI